MMLERCSDSRSVLILVLIAISHEGANPGVDPENSPAPAGSHPTAQHPMIRPRFDHLGHHSSAGGFRKGAAGIEQTPADPAILSLFWKGCALC